jgi:D-alanyl-D-alanine dipeptidase
MFSVFSSINMRSGALLATIVIISFFIFGCTKQKESLPDGFVFITDVDPTIIESMRYATEQNFLGRVVPGYSADQRIACTKQAAEALKAAHELLKKQGYTLVIYDAYRPQRSVDAFVKWADDLNDAKAKPLYYPSIDKENLFKLQYIAKKSSHTRGSSFDLSIIKTGEQVKPVEVSTRKLADGTPIPFLDDNTIDMGSSFDLFHPASHHDSALVSDEQTKLRNMLRDIMKAQGFKEYKEEWWHYILANEPYPDTYFDFIV